MKIKLSENAKTVLYKRDYLKKSRSGRVIETVERMFKRVANGVAAASGAYGEDVVGDAHAFYRLMARMEFLPNSPTLMHAGRNGFSQLSACFVLPIEDSLESIFKTLHDAALVLRTGGGVGYSFSKLRPRGDRIMTTGGIASGPVSFMELFDHMAKVINEGSSRRVAMMGILRVDHPDIEEFITVKASGKRLTNFNVSVGITDEFMEALSNGKKYALVDPVVGKVVKRVWAEKIFDLISEHAWMVADPGLVFLDRMNRACPIRHLGEIEATNPCGEQPLLPYQSCNLGSINLSRFVTKGEINWKRLRKVVRLAVKFLDNVIDACDYPLDEITEMSRKTRKVGLGVMGWADMLFKLGIAYDTQEAVNLAKRLAAFIEKEAREESVKLGKMRGSFSAFAGSSWEKKYPAMRNSTITTIAPTGTISILASCSSGIEPVFALSFTRRNILDIGKTELVEFNNELESQLKKLVTSKSKRKKILNEVVKIGSCQDVDGVPEIVRRVFVTSHDIDWKWHVRMQAAWQSNVDSAVSKTVNLARKATISDVSDAYKMAYKTGCMGITIYRDKSRSQQVLNLGIKDAKSAKEASRLNGEDKQHEHEPEIVMNGERGICPECKATMVYQDGCATCPQCAYSYCSTG